MPSDIARDLPSNSGPVRSCRFGPVLVDYDERVLTPRPWTLRQSEWAAALGTRSAPILELCAGVGHIGLAAAVLADCDLIQVEADPVAAGYARANAERAGWSSRVEIRNVALQRAIEPAERFDVIIADPPYLRTVDLARWPDDPPAAIDGGEDGLDLVTACLDVASRHLTPAGQLLLQVAGPAQEREIEKLLDAVPAWGLARCSSLVVDDERAVVLIGRDDR